MPNGAVDLGLLSPHVVLGGPMLPMPIELILTRQWSLNLATPVLIVNQDDRLTFVNNAALALLGRTRDDLIDKPTHWLADSLGVREANTGEPLDPSQLKVTHLARNLGPRHIRLRYHVPGGEEQLIDLTALPLEGQGTRPVGATTTQRGSTLGAALLFWEVRDS